MMKFCKIFAVIIMLSLSTSCTGLDGQFDIRKPYSLDMNPPEGPPEYRQGWTDGCESGVSVYTNNFMKFLNVFKYKQDPKLRKNKFYYRAWKDAFRYCAMFMETATRSKI